MKHFLNFVFICSILFPSCNSEKSKDEYLRGKLKLYSDPAFTSFVNSEADLFQHFYKEASLNVLTAPQDSAIDRFLNGDAEMIAVSRKLNDDEKNFLSRKNIQPQEYVVAKDAIVFIVSKERKDSVLSLPQLSNIMSGKITDWKQMGSTPGQVNLVVAQSKSADLNYLVQKMTPDTSLKVFAAGSYEKVIEYVGAHPSSIGVIDLSTMRTVLRDKTQNLVKVMAINAEDHKSYYPFQSDLASDGYPFKRDIYLTCKFKTSLGTGFVSYVLTEDGQRVALKSGLLPATMPGREIMIKKD